MSNFAARERRQIRFLTGALAALCLGAAVAPAFAAEGPPNFAPDNATEIKALEEDGGRFIGYVRVVGRRRGEAKLEEYCWPDTLRSIPQQYTKKPLLRSQDK